MELNYDRAGNPVVIWADDNYGSHIGASVWTDGTERRAEDFRVVHYDTPVGNAAAYYPETNVLVPLDSTADGSGTPTSKSVIIRLERRGSEQPSS